MRFYQHTNITVLQAVQHLHGQFVEFMVLQTGWQV